jgi:hypothetical protein
MANNLLSKTAMKKKVFIAAFAGLVLLAGCVTPPTAEERASFDYGPPPKNHEATIKKYFSDLLFDPYSAQYEFEPPKQQWIKEAPLAGGRTYVGHLVRCSVNAKNRFGAYVGKKQYGFIIKDERIIKVIEDYDAANIRQYN